MIQQDLENIFRNNYDNMIVVVTTIIFLSISKEMEIYFSSMNLWFQIGVMFDWFQFPKTTYGDPREREVW